ncbi:MAG: hypothetical protein RL217_1189, partial [Pseudomonadota bacterium]
MFNNTDIIHASVWLLAYFALLLWSFRQSLFSRQSHPRGSRIFAYASMGGTAQKLAEQLAQAHQEQAVSLNKLTDKELGQAQELFIIASTYGEGEAPDNGRLFAAHLAGKTGDLSRLKFAVLGLGDSHYAQYCAFAKQIFAQLSAKNAQPYFDLICVDRMDIQALAWWQEQLRTHAGLSFAAVTVEKDPCFSASLQKREHLNPGSQGGALYQLDFSVPKAVQWQAGDIAQLHGQTRREYSIASVVCEQTLRLLVRERRHADGSLGLGSALLCRDLSLGESAIFSVRKNPSFYAPKASHPMILIGNGTGLAGLRAHMAARPLGSLTWLIFGERHPKYDATWHNELWSWRETGRLSQLDLAFSRVQAADMPQVGLARWHPGYVQQVLHKHSLELKSWLNQGAVMYLCGSR